MVDDPEVNIRQVDHGELEELLDWCEEAKLPLMISGTFGIGKSDTVRRKAKEFADRNDDREFVHFNRVGREKVDDIMENPENYYVFFDIRLAENRPEDIKGIPDLDNEHKVTDWRIPKWGKIASLEGIAGTIFLDEVNLANPSVQSAFYKLILDRQIGDTQLAEDIFVVSAGNRAGKDQANVHEMPAPLRNRFTHVELDIPAGGRDGDWTEWAIENDLHDFVVSYVGSPAGANELHKFTEKESDHKAIATPRTWEYVSDMLYAIEEEKGEVTPEDVELAGSTAVGQGIAQEFAGYIRIREDFNPQKYVDNPEMAEELNDQSSDVQVSVVTGVASIYRHDTDKLENVFEMAIHLNEELGSLLLYLSKKYHPRHFKDAIYNPEKVDSDISDEVADQYMKIIAEDEDE